MERSERIALAALVVSLLSAGAAWRGHELNVVRDQREQRAKRPAIDIQMSPAQSPDDTVLDVSITNRSDVDIFPEAVAAIPRPIAGFDMGSGGRLFIGAPGAANIDQPTMWLTGITIKPGETKKTKLIMRSQSPIIPAGMEIQFVFSVRLADDQDSVEQYRVVRKYRFY